MISYKDYVALASRGFQPGMNESGGSGPNLLSESVWNTMSDDEKWNQMGGMFDLGEGDPGYEAIRDAIQSAHPGSDTRSIAVSRTPGGADPNKTVKLPDGTYAWSVDNSVHPKESDDWKMALAGTGLVLGGGMLANSFLPGAAGSAEAATGALPDSYWSAVADSGAVASDAAPAASAGGTALSGAPEVAAATGPAMSTAPGTIPSVTEYLANPASWAPGSGTNMSWIDTIRELLPQGVRDLPWKDILSGASDIFAGNRAERNTEADFNRSANFSREMWGEALRASRPNQTNAWGATRKWERDANGNWVQKDSFSPSQQRRADIYDSIAEQRLAAAQAGIKPDYERMGFGHLLSGGTTGQRPWANSPTSSMGGDQLRNLSAPSLNAGATNNTWGPLPSGPPPVRPPAPVQPPAPSPMGPSAGGNMAMRPMPTQPPAPMEGMGTPPQPMGMPGPLGPSAGGLALTPEQARLATMQAITPGGF